MSDISIFGTLAPNPGSTAPVVRAKHVGGTYSSHADIAARDTAFTGVGSDYLGHIAEARDTGKWWHLDSVGPNVWTEKTLGPASSTVVLRDGSQGLTADWNVNSHSITGLSTPLVTTAAATKGYVDAVAQGLDVKTHVNVLATANVTLSGAQTIDTVVGTAGVTHVLAIGQTDQKENGPWIMQAGAWTRPADFAVGSAAGSSFFFVQKGSAGNIDTGWVCTSDAGSDVVGTNNLTFVQFSAAGVIAAGNGLSKSGNTLSVLAANTTITVSGSGVSVGTITNANITDTTISPAKLSSSSAATGQPMVWSGTAWAPSDSFGARNLSTTGSFSVGTNAAGTGAFRLANALAISSRDSGNANDRQLIQLDSTDVVRIGDLTGLMPISLSSATLRFNATVTPALYQNDLTTVGGTGQQFTLHAQDSTGLSSNGGKLLLRSGAGTATAGNVEFQRGTTSALLFDGTSANFNANNLVTTGKLALGTSPSSQGDIRLPYNFTMQARDATNVFDVQLLSYSDTTFAGVYELFVGSGNSSLIQTRICGNSGVALHSGPTAPASNTQRFSVTSAFCKTTTPSVLWDSTSGTVITGTGIPQLNAISGALEYAGIPVHSSSTGNTVAGLVLIHGGDNLCPASTNNTAGRTWLRGANASNAISGVNTAGALDLQAGAATVGTGAGATVNGAIRMLNAAGTERFKLDDGGIAWFGAATVGQQADMVALTDSTTGSATTTIGDVGAAFSQSTLNNIHVSLLTQINKVRTVLRNYGLMA